MLIIPIKEGENIDRALKRYKRKFDKQKTVRQLRARTAFIKPSVK
jgi:small subunit ribosomal protein S21